MITLFLALFLGILIGIFTGITPGIHTNLVAVIILSSLFLRNQQPEILIIFIVSLSITHTFLDSIPSIYLGAPDSDHVMSILPGHKYFLEGKAYEAFILTLIGSLSAVIISIIFFLPLIYLIKNYYLLIYNYIPYILIFSLLILLLKERYKFTTLVIIFLAGILGISVLSLNLNQPLLPLFSGLFALPSLILSLSQKTELKEQIITFPVIKIKELTITLFLGLFSSILSGTLPGLGPAQAASLVDSIKKIKQDYYLVLTGSLNTFIMIISFFTLYAIDKARNGSVVAISELVNNFSYSYLLLALSVSLAASGIAVLISIKIAKKFSILISKINYKLLSIIIILFITALTIYLTNLIGLLILLTAACLGLFVNLKGISRSNLMACLIIPVIFYYLL
ncbi:tripartite tricarboxylate transporter permease [Candidatus Woesearchaeota archaeon]|nr:tripartite tricarboxylate transporter permease [Candidatus Woesearchaeota archaeon]